MRSTLPPGGIGRRRTPFSGNLSAGGHDRTYSPAYTRPGRAPREQPNPACWRQVAQQLGPLRPGCRCRSSDRAALARLSTPTAHAALEPISARPSRLDHGRVTRVELCGIAGVDSCRLGDSAASGRTVPPVPARPGCPLRPLEPHGPCRVRSSAERSRVAPAPDLTRPLGDERGVGCGSSASRLNGSRAPGEQPRRLARAAGARRPCARAARVLLRATPRGPRRIARSSSPASTSPPTPHRLRPVRTGPSGRKYLISRVARRAIRTPAPRSLRACPAPGALDELFGSRAGSHPTSLTVRLRVLAAALEACRPRRGLGGRQARRAPTLVPLGRALAISRRRRGLGRRACASS